MDQLVVSPDKFLGRLVTEVDLGPGLAERVMGCIKTALEERRLVVMEYEAVIAAGPRRFEGRFVPLDAERVILVARDITEARRHEELLSASLAEKEVLLREVHHRVKNNLQVISSLVSLQETSCRDQSEREMNRDTQVRIRSMAHLHELLYGSKDLSSIDSAEYLRAIVGEISGYYENPLIHVEAEPDILSIDEAMPFGLIVTELVTNALKYAYPHGSAGHIFIFYGRSALARRLEVRDEGVGLPPDFDPANSASLGYTLIRSLSDQIDGRLTIRAANPGEALPGLSVVLTFSILPREIQASLPGA
jgi:two-component sensor histidine kinase